jgi:hypothetical protein
LGVDLTHRQVENRGAVIVLGLFAVGRFAEQSHAPLRRVLRILPRLLGGLDVGFRRGAEGRGTGFPGALRGARGQRVDAVEQKLVRSVAFRPRLLEGDEPERAQTHLPPAAAMPIHHDPADRAAGGHLQIEAVPVRMHAERPGGGDLLDAALGQTVNEAGHDRAGLERAQP